MAEGSLVVYFDVDGMPGTYFTCARYGTMSPGSCARNYTDAPNQVKSGRLAGCVGCPIGRQHAGVDIQSAKAVGDPTTQTYRPVCLRCRRSGRDSTSRLIARMRLIRGHTICVSCYNREREVLHGKNSKGAPPRKWAGLYVTQVSTVRNGQAVARTALKVPVRDRIELALVTLRQANVDGVFFAAPPIARLP